MTPPMSATKTHLNPNFPGVSQKRYLLSANGALLTSAWGNAPGIVDQEGLSAESACHEPHESRLQRSPLISTRFLGRCPRFATANPSCGGLRLNQRFQR